jgi:hypothetical protein
MSSGYLVCMSVVMIAPGTVILLTRLKTPAQAAGLSSFLGPYFFRLRAANGPLAGIEATSRLRTNRSFGVTTKEIATGFSLICSEVSMSSN